MRQAGLRIAVVVILAFVALGCGGKRRPPVTAEHEHGSAGSLAAQLEDAYRSASDDQLAAFFRHWHESVQPTHLESVQDPLERELYALYLAFFRPFNLDELMGQFLQDSEETYNNRYDNAKYLVVPTKLRFRVGNGSEDTLRDFRPDVQVPRIPVVFLTPEYQEALVRFLEGRTHVRDVDTANVSDDSLDDWFERFQFVNRQITIMPGHWDGWDLLSYPIVILVELNDEMTEAYISWSEFSLFGMTVMHRESDRWVLKDSGVVGMQ
jgi:hypothetical protein